jgi:nucleoside triphosphate diphosphatase
VTSSGERRAVGEAVATLDEITRTLRRECPWDRAQDERSIVPHTVEEAYELADAAHEGDDAKLLDELGDVLFQVHFLALLLEERSAGGIEQVARGVTEKLVRRHPHVFGDGGAELASLPTEARTPAQVRENWDAIKRREAPEAHPLATVSETLPSLLYARKLQRRAGGGDRVGPELALERLRERVDAVAAAIADECAGASAQEETRHGSKRLYELVGRLLFEVVGVAGAIQVDPELALRLENRRFRDDTIGETGA